MERKCPTTGKVKQQHFSSPLLTKAARRSGERQESSDSGIQNPEHDVMAFLKAHQGSFPDFPRDPQMTHAPPIPEKKDSVARHLSTGRASRNNARELTASDA